MLLGSGCADPASPNNNGNQLRKVTLNTIRPANLWFSLRLVKSVGILHMVILPSCGYIAKCLKGTILLFGYQYKEGYFEGTTHSLLGEAMATMF
jgi:hypothetical protein